MATNLMLQPINPQNNQELNQLLEALDHDFPRFARIPWKMLRSGIKKNSLQAFFFVNQSQNVGYAITQKALELDLLHILYFAIDPKYRQQGYGSQALSLLDQAYPEGILLDVELPLVEEETVAREKKQRRILFYERNGFRLQADFKFNNFGYEMGIMSNEQLPEQDWLPFYRRLYNQAYGLPISRVAIRPSKKVE